MNLGAIPPGAQGIEAIDAPLSSGSAASRVLEVFGSKMASRDFKAGVEARLHHKDFAILMNEAAAQVR